MPERTASCSCGKLVVHVRSEPVRVSICHCPACQKRTGSIFGVQARFPRDAVGIEGDSREYVRVGDSGACIRFHFCPACGATVFQYLDAVPGFISIPVGAFADPAFPRPWVSVYEQRRHAWFDLPDGIEHHG